MRNTRGLKRCPGTGESPCSSWISESKEMCRECVGTMVLLERLRRLPIRG